MRIVVRALLPLGEGAVLDPFMGSGSTIAAALARLGNAELVTGDPEFKAVEGEVKVAWLPKN